MALIGIMFSYSLNQDNSSPFIHFIDFRCSYTNRQVAIDFIYDSPLGEVFKYFITKSFRNISSHNRFSKLTLLQ